MLGNLPATLTDLAARAIALGRTLARTLSTIETRDPAHDALLRRIIMPLRARNPFDGLNDADLAELEALLDLELTHEIDGLELCAGYSVTIGEETIHGDPYTAPRLTARGKHIHHALRQLRSFTEARDHVLDHAAAQRKPMP